MENDYQTIKNPRRAKLVELVDENLNQVYKFTESSIGFRNTLKKEGSRLDYLTYRGISNIYPDVDDIKHKAMKTFEDNYNKDLVFVQKESGIRKYLFDKNSGNSIEELQEMKFGVGEKLENTRFKNWYNPFTKKSNKKEISLNFGKFVLDALEFGGIGIGIYDLVAQNPHISAGNWLGLGIFTGIMNEFGRKTEKWNAKKELKHINQNIEYYDNFRRNIEKAEVSIISPEEAQEIYQDLKDSKGTGRFVKVDFDSANKELINVYGRY